MWHGHGNCRRQVYYHLALRARLPYIYYFIAYIKGEFHLRSGETLRRIFKHEFRLRHFFSIFVHQPGSEYGYVLYLFLGLSENLLSLRHGSGVVKVNHRLFDALEGFESLFDYMLSRLCENLYRHVVRYQVFFYQSSKKIPSRKLPEIPLLFL